MNFLLKIFRGSKETFGLDIGYNTLKVVQLKRTGAFFKLIGCGVFPSPPQVFERNGIKQKTELAKIIKEAVDKCGIRAKLVTSALPESLVFTKIIQLPKMNKKQLASAIALEASSFVPMEPEQVFLDYQVVRELENNYEVLVVAAPKKVVNDLVQTIDEAGFKLICLETKPLANARALVTNKEGVLILDIGAETTSITICEKGSIRLTATFAFGSDTFTKKISSALGIQESEAEKLKQKVGISKNENKIRKILEEPLGVLLSEIARAIKYYQSQKGEAGVSKILLTGGGAGLSGLVNFIQEGTGLKTERGNPWRRVTNPPKREDSFIFTTAVGLSMREI